MDRTSRSGEDTGRSLLRREARAEQTWRLFVKDLCERARVSPEIAERAAVAVLSCLGQRILADEMRDLEAQLPLKLQNLIAKEGAPRPLEPESFSRDEYVERVGAQLGMMASEAEPLVRNVLGVVADHVSTGELEDVTRQLPMDWMDLWQRPM